MERHRLQKLRNATFTNIGLAFYSVGAFALTGNSAFIAESLHDTADSGAHGSRYLAEKLKVDQETKKFKWFLRAGLLGVSALSGYTAFKIGIDLTNGAVEESSTRDNVINLVSAGVIGAGNTYAYRQVESIEEHSHASEASHDHAKVDMIASWGLVGSIAVGALGVEKASTVGGMLFASYTSAHLVVHAFKKHTH